MLEKLVKHLQAHAVESVRPKFIHRRPGAAGKTSAANAGAFNRRWRGTKD